MRNINTRFNIDELNRISKELSKIYDELNDELLRLIARRLKTTDDLGKALDRDTVLQWQIEKLNHLGSLNDDAIKAIARATNTAEQEALKKIEKMGYDVVDATDMDIKEIMNVPSMVSKNTGYVKQVTEAMVKQMFREHHNFINQSLITHNFGTGLVSREYEDIINNVTIKVLSGITTIDKAVTSSVMSLANKGIPSGFVDRGGNRWSLRRYAETTIRTTVNRTYNELRMNRMQEFGVNLVVVSSLPDPREICSKIQGKVASIDEPAQNNTNYPSIYDYGYGTPGGLRGINCRHMFFPYVEGVNINNQIQYSEEEMTRNRNNRIRQTQLEGQIRKAKTRLEMAKELGDEQAIRRYRNQVRDRQARLRKFLSETGRGRRFDRERVYDFSPENLRAVDMKRMREIQRGTLVDHSYDFERNIQALEKRIQNQSYETAHVFDSKGRELWSHVGDDTSVDIRDAIRKGLVENNILTHNHPSGGSFSPQDIDMLYRHQMKEIRAIGRNGNLARATVDAQNRDIFNLKIAIKRADSDVRDMMWDAINNGEITPEMASTEHFHEVWQRVAMKTGLKYERVESDAYRILLNERKDYVKRAEEARKRWKNEKIKFY